MKYTNVILFMALCSTKVALACGPDINNNGVVNAQDMTILRRDLGTSNPRSDLDNSGSVNTRDLTLMRNALGTKPVCQKVSFAATSSSALENAGSIALQVRLSGATTYPVTVYFTSSGTAVRNIDFSRSDAITIPAGQVSANLVVNLLDDSVYEGNENLVIRISSSSYNVLLGNNLSNTLTIADNETAPPAFGEATLAWDANPTTEGGLTLAGYKVYYRTASGSYGAGIDAAKLTTKTISGLTKGATYYFAVTAYDTKGVESNKSAEVSKLIPQ